MMVNSGSLADNEETLLQTPGPLKDYSRSRITERIQRRAHTPGIAYRTRSKDKILTKLQLIIDDLINIIDDDIELDNSMIKTRKDRNDEEAYCLVDEDSSYSYVLNPSKNTKDLEIDIQRRVQFRDVIESLDSSIGALVKVKCMEEQDEKLKKFTNASEVLVLQVKKVKENGDWKMEDESGSPRETEETSTLRSMTFTVDGGECLIMKNTIILYILIEYAILYFIQQKCTLSKCILLLNI